VLAQVELFFAALAMGDLDSEQNPGAEAEDPATFFPETEMVCD
jgi:hypothetical protein